MIIEGLQSAMDELSPLVIEVGMFDSNTLSNSEQRTAAKNKLDELLRALRLAHWECLCLQENIKNENS